jgi:hypothetical protein
VPGAGAGTRYGRASSVFCIMLSVLSAASCQLPAVDNNNNNNKHAVWRRLGPRLGWARRAPRAASRPRVPMSVLPPEWPRWWWGWGHGVGRRGTWNGAGAGAVRAVRGPPRRASSQGTSHLHLEPRIPSSRHNSVDEAVASRKPVGSQAIGAFCRLSGVKSGGGGCNTGGS